MNFVGLTNWRFEYLTVAGILHAFSRRLINWSNPRACWRPDSRERSSELASGRTRSRSIRPRARGIVFG